MMTRLLNITGTLRVLLLSRNVLINDVGLKQLLSLLVFFGGALQFRLDLLVGIS